jgi:hypothetical protein
MKLRGVTPQSVHCQSIFAAKVENSYFRREKFRCSKFRNNNSLADQTLSSTGISRQSCYRIVYIQLINPRVCFCYNNKLKGSTVTLSPACTPLHASGNTI